MPLIRGSTSQMEPRFHLLLQRSSPKVGDKYVNKLRIEAVLLSLRLTYPSMDRREYATILIFRR